MAIVRLPRFTLTERAAHWLVAVTFGVMLLTGTMVPHHWSVSDISFDVHVGAAVVLVCGLAMLLFAANRRALRATCATSRRRRRAIAPGCGVRRCARCTAALRRPPAGSTPARR